MDLMTLSFIGLGMVLAVLGGVFFAFSDFIIRALRSVQGAGGMASMQRINTVIMQSVFMVLFIGLTLATLGLAVAAGLTFAGAARAFVLMGAIAYGGGVFTITAVFNVPLNNRLAGLDPKSDAGQAYWRQIYLPRWSLWNSIRAMNCLIASACFILAGL